MKSLIKTLFLLLLITGCSAEKDKAPEVIIQEEDPQQLLEDLFKAVLINDVDSVNELVQKSGTDLSAYDDKGFTALMRAVQSSTSPFIVETLINAGAKIYQPSKNRDDLTAESIVSENAEIKRLISDEKIRLATKLEDLISLKDFESATKTVEENYLPYSLTMPSSTETALSLSLKKLSSTSHASVDFITSQLQKNVAADVNLTSISTEAIRAASRVKSDKLLDAVLKALKSNSYISIFMLLDEDFTNTTWLTKKLELINKYGLSTSLSSEVDSLTNAMERLRIENKKDEFFALHVAIQKTSERDFHKSLVFQNALKKLEAGLGTRPEQIRWISESVDIWKENRNSVESSGYSFDEHTLLVLKGLQNTNIDLFELDQIFTQLSIFAPSYENKSEESIKFIINTDTYEFIVKKRILEMLLKRTKALPDNIVAYAVENGGVPAVELILDAGIEFTDESQSSAVLTALEKTKSGDAAYGILVLLNEKGVAFNTESGKAALSLTIKKLWEERNATYRGVYDYLVSLPNSPITNMTNDEIISSLRTLLNYVREEKAQWQQITQFVERISDSVVQDKAYIKEDVKFGEDTIYDIQVSFVWDFIMSAYDIINERPSELDIMLVTTRKIVEKFNKEIFSFSFVGDHFHKLERLSLSQNLTALSLMLTLDKTEIETALKISEELSHAELLETMPSYFSWETFLDGEPYKYYSKRKSFWESITDILLESGADFVFLDQKHYILLAKILVHSGKINRFPVLMDKIKNTKMTFFDHQKVCVLDKEKYDSADLPKLDLKNEGDGEVSASGYNPAWANLGAFEVLLPLQEKTCKETEKLSSEEINLLRGFISNNLKAPEDPGPYNRGYSSDSVATPRRVEKCSAITEAQNFLFGYDYAGTVLRRLGRGLENVPSSAPSNRQTLMTGFGDNRQCYIFNYSFDADYKAKVVMLKNWFQCSVDSGDDALTRLFESLDTVHNIQPSNDNEGIHFCRW